MGAELFSGILKDRNVRVLVAVVTDVCRQARDLHQLAPGSAVMLAQGLSCGALVAFASQKERQVVNLQLECDGPLRGLFVDAHRDGALRGYVKNPRVEFQGEAGSYQWRPILGNSGFLSVLTDLGQGEFYRSSVALGHFELGRDLEEYFRTSVQVPTAVHLEVVADEGEPLGQVGAVLIQALPDGERETVSQLMASAGPQLRSALGKAGGASAAELAHQLFPQEPLGASAVCPLVYRCSCSKERVTRALISLGRAELQSLLEGEKQAQTTCQFCGRAYLISEEELRALLASLPPG